MVLISPLMMCKEGYTVFSIFQSRGSLGMFQILATGLTYFQDVTQLFS